LVVIDLSFLGGESHLRAHRLSIATSVRAVV
jgi:hypothetical protein